MDAACNEKGKLLLRNVTGALNDWEPGILRESRITQRELAKIKAGTSVGFDDTRVLTIDT